MILQDNLCLADTKAVSCNGCFWKIYIVLRNHTGKVKGNTVILAGNVAFYICSIIRVKKLTGIPLSLSRLGRAGSDQQ